MLMFVRLFFSTNFSYNCKYKFIFKASEKGLYFILFFVWKNKTEEKNCCLFYVFLIAFSMNERTNARKAASSADSQKEKKKVNTIIIARG